MGPNITCRALVLKTADPAQSMYIGNLDKQIWALITYIGPGPEVLSSDRPTIYNHAPRVCLKLDWIPRWVGLSLRVLNSKLYFYF